MSKKRHDPFLHGKSVDEDLPDEKEQTKYFAKPISAVQIILLLTSFLALLVLVMILVTVFVFEENAFYFGDNVYSYVLYGLIMLLIINFITIVYFHIMSNTDMPTYEEYKKSINRREFIKKRRRFPNLNDYDELYKNYKRLPPLREITLEKFCDDFRSFMANELRLYFSIDEVRKFVTGLGVSKTMILQGMSGTGKTSLAVAFGRFIDVPSTVVPIQPMWKERSDLLGYYNEFTGKFNETMILQKLYEASYTDKIFIIVLDELNIARVEYYFAEFLSLLELPPTSERQLVVAATGAYEDPIRMKRGNIILPDNVWFLGTANNDDSTFAISDKVYDRAMVMNLDMRSAPFAGDKDAKQTRLSYPQFMYMVRKAQENYTLSEEAVQRIKEFDDYLIHNFYITFGNRILMQLYKYVPLYIACGGTEEEAIDDFLTKKTLRKLEGKNPVYLKAKSGELLAKIDEIFGADTMVVCKTYITNLVDNL